MEKSSEEIIVNGRLFYKPVVSYFYYVDSRKYYSTSVSLLGIRSFDSKVDVELLLDDISMAWYCPAWPRISYLFREFRFLYGLFFVNSALCASMCFLWYF